MSRNLLQSFLSVLISMCDVKCVQPRGPPFLLLFFTLLWCLICPTTQNKANNAHHGHRKDKKSQGRLPERLFVTEKKCICTAQKLHPFRYLFCKSDQILRKLRILSLLMKKSLIENFTFCAVMNEKSWSCIKICYFMNVFCRSVFRTQINIYDGAYLRKESTAKRQFYKMIPFMRSKYLYVLYNGFFSWRRLFKPIL